MVDGAPPSAWRVARAILPMPFVATVIVPGLIVAVADERWGWDGGGAGGGDGRRCGLDRGGCRALRLDGEAVRVPRPRHPRALGSAAPTRRRRPVSPPAPSDDQRSRHRARRRDAGLRTSPASRSGWRRSSRSTPSICPWSRSRRLRRRFGDDYDRYMGNVNRWVPRLRPWDPGPRA